MAHVSIPEHLAPECTACKKARIMDWDAPALTVGKVFQVPFKIHVENYHLDTTKFKLIDYKSTRMNATCPGCHGKIQVNLLFDDEGRSFGIFTDRIEDRYLFQHSSGIPDKEKYYKSLLALDFSD